ncbi:MAG: arylsulfatase, partial [Puniceicoccaceae bacterium]
EKLKSGHSANGKEWRVHLDGYDFSSDFKGEVEDSPRDSILYFDQLGALNAVRWNDWKVHFAMIEGNIATGVRNAPGWPLVINLKADPFEEMWEESSMYIRWYADNMWLFVPIQDQIQQFLATLPDYPFQEGAALSADGINYRSLKAMKIIQQLEKSGIPLGQ